MDIRNEINKYIFQLWQELPDGCDVLEVGSGGKSSTLALFKDNHNFVPTDVFAGDDWVIPEAKFLDVETMNTNEVMLEHPLWDVIIANQVFEHVKHPQLAIYNCYEHLKDGGILLMSTPFMYRIHEHDLDNGETTEVGVMDYWRFTPRGYEILFSEGGFQQWYITKIGTEELFPYTIVGIAFKKIGKPQGEILSWTTKELPSDWLDLMQKKLANLTR